MTGFRQAAYQLRRTRGRVQHLHARRIAIIILILCFYFLGLGLSISMVLSGAHWWEIDVQQQQGAWKLVWFDESSPMTEYNLQPGDTILRADGQIPHSATEINRANILLFLHEGTEHEIDLRTNPTIFSLPLAVGWILAGAVSLIVSLLVYVHATDRMLATLFCILWSAFALIAALEPAAVLGNPFGAITAEVLTSALFFPMLLTFLWLFLFPRQRHRWAPKIPLVLGAVAVAFIMVSLQVRQPAFTMMLFAALFAQEAIILCLSLVFIIRASRSKLQVQAERARTIIGGALISCLPLLTTTILPALVTGSDLLAGPATGLFAGILPLAFGYAIIRRDTLHLDALARRTARVVLAIVGSIIVAVLVLQGLLLLPPLAALLIGMFAGAALLPAIWQVARWGTDVWLFPQIRQMRGTYVPATRERTPAELAAQLIARVVERLPLQPQHAAVCLLGPQSRFTPLAAELPPFLADDQLYLALKRSPAPLFVEPKEPSADILQWHLLVPLCYSRLVGVLALSQREDGQEYSETDLQFLRLLVGAQEMTLEYAVLFAELHAARQQGRRQEQITSALAKGASSLLENPLEPVKRHIASFQDLTPREIAERADEVHETAQRLGRDVSAIDADFQRWKGSVMQVAYTPALQQRSGELHDLVSEIILLLDERVQAGHHVIHNQVPAGLVAQGDTSIIARVLWQLLSNALEASGSHKPIFVQGTLDNITANMLTSFKNGVNVANRRWKREARAFEGPIPVDDRLVPIAKLVVRDTGAPVAERDLPFVFDPFSPDHEPDKRPGLPMCWEMIVEGLGGGIWIEFDPLTGQTSVHFVLPLAIPELPREQGEGQENGSTIGFHPNQGKVSRSN